MTVQRRWSKTLSDGSVTVRRVTDDVTDETAAEYTIDIPGRVADVAELEPLPPNSEASVRLVDGHSRHDYAVTVPDGSGVVRLALSIGGDRHLLYLPGPTLLRRCVEAIDGDTDAARELVGAFAAPPRIPAVCGAFLSIPEVGQLLETLGRVNGYVASFLHAYRYDVVRGAVVSPVGLSVDSTDELEALADALDAIDTIGPVGLVDSLGDAMAAVLTSDRESTAVLEDLGYDLATLERRNDDLFFACRLARLVLDDGIRAAEGLAMRRRWHVDGDYARRNALAKSEQYYERGQTWRELLCLAARQSLDEFAFALANALYWSAEVMRTDSRTDELLLDAAVTAAAEIGLSQVEGRARYEHRLSRGHRLRSQKCYALARTEFERAGAVAAEYDFLPDWEPIYSKALVHSAEHGTDGRNEAAVSVISDALDSILEHDVPAEKLNHIVHHLEGQKREQQAKLADFQADGPDPVSLLQEASTHYDAIDMERSRDRAERKLEQLKRDRQAADEADSNADSQTAQTAASDEDPSPSSSETTQPSSPNSTSSASGRTSASGTSSKGGDAAHSFEKYVSRKRRQRQTGGHVRSEYAQDEFESNPELNDFLAPSDPDETGGADLMTSPDDREETPYADDRWGREEGTDPGL